MTTKPAKLSGPKAKPSAHSVAKVNQKVNKTTGPLAVGDVKGTCPYKSKPNKASNTIVVCDIASLSLHDKTSEKTLICFSHDKSPLPETVPKRIANLLSSYDLVMELVSDYELVTKTGQQLSEKSIVELDIKRKGKGTCPLHEHPSVKITASNPKDAIHTHDWKTENPSLLKIPARPLPVIDRMISWILPFWNFSTGEMDFTIVGAGCGVGVSSPVNHELKSLVRIYPNDKFELTLTLPPFKKWTHEKESRGWHDKKMKSGTTSFSTFGKKTYESGYEREKDGDQAAKWSSTKGILAYGQYEEKKVSYEGGKRTEKESSTGYSLGGLKSTTLGDDGKPEHATSVKLELKRNGEKYDLEKTLGTIVNLVFTIMTAILRIKDIINIIPKIGLTYSIEACILEGGITASWGNRFPEGTAGAGDRYTAVDSYFDVELELKLFDVAFELGFGFELKIPPIVDWFSSQNTLEIVLKAAIKASIDTGINYTAKSSSKDNHKIKIESKPKLKVYIEFNVNAFGKGLKSDGGIRGGLECEASFHVSFSHAPNFEAKVGSKPIEVYGQYFIDLVLWDSSDHWEYELVGKRTFYDGPLPPSIGRGAGGTW